MNMKFSLIVCLGMLLHLSVSNPVNNTQYDENLAYDEHQDPQLWQKSGQFQGDIVLTPEQAENLFSEKEERNGVINTRFRWPNRVIPYVISNDFTASEKSFIERVIKEDYARTCIRVVRRTNQADYVHVTGKNTGCWSYVGRRGGKQELNLQRNGCLWYPTIVHEFLHAAGFYHQHSATDRNNYVAIQWGNIQSGFAYAFDRYGTNVISSYGQRYDYGSVMHYGAYAFSKNGQRTIIPRQNVQIGTAQRLSSIDVAKLNRMYNC